MSNKSKIAGLLVASVGVGVAAGIIKHLKDKRDLAKFEAEMLETEEPNNLDSFMASIHNDSPEVTNDDSEKLLSIYGIKLSKLHTKREIAEELTERFGEPVIYTKCLQKNTDSARHLVYLKDRDMYIEAETVLEPADWCKSTVFKDLKTQKVSVLYCDLQTAVVEKNIPARIKVHESLENMDIIPGSNFKIKEEYKGNGRYDITLVIGDISTEFGLNGTDVLKVSLDNGIAILAKYLETVYSIYKFSREYLPVTDVHTINLRLGNRFGILVAVDFDIVGDIVQEYSRVPEDIDLSLEDIHKALSNRVYESIEEHNAKADTGNKVNVLDKLKDSWGSDDDLFGDITDLSTESNTDYSDQFSSDDYGEEETEKSYDNYRVSTGDNETPEEFLTAEHEEVEETKTESSDILEEADGCSFVDDELEDNTVYDSDKEITDEEELW